MTLSLKKLSNFSLRRSGKKTQPPKKRKFESLFEEDCIKKKQRDQRKKTQPNLPRQKNSTPPGKKTQPKMDVKQMMSSLQEWSEAGILDQSQSEAVSVLIGQEDPNPMIVGAIFSGCKDASKKLDAKKEEEQKMKVMIEEKWKAHLETLKDVEDGPLNATPPQGFHYKKAKISYKKKDKETGEMNEVWNPVAGGKSLIIPHKYVNGVLNLINQKKVDIENEVKEELKPKSKKKKDGGSRVKIDEDHYVWDTNTEDEAKEDYDNDKLFCMEMDKDKETIYQEIIKSYKKGSKDPRPKDHPEYCEGGKLDKDLRKKRWSSCCHSTTFQDIHNEKRCHGAKVWKGGRNGSEYTKEHGIRGAVMMCCNLEVEPGTFFCVTCAKKDPPQDFYEMKYKKTSLGDDKPMSDFLKDAVKCG